MNATRTFASLTVVVLASLLAVVLTAAAGTDRRAAPLTAHVLRSGELAGFTRNGAPELVRAPLVWARRTADGAPGETAMLRRLGFVAAASVHLASPGHDDREALSYAVEFRTVQAARAYLTRTVTRLSRAASGERVSVLCAIDPLGSYRLDVSSATALGHNLLFQHGRFVHLVGVGYAPSAVPGPTIRQLALAASALIRRIDTTAS